MSSFKDWVMECEDELNQLFDINDNILLEEKIDKEIQLMYQKMKLQEMLIQSRKWNAEYNFFIKSICIEFEFGEIIC